MKKLVLLTFLLFILIGCSETIEYNSAQNIRVDGEILKWDEVKGAQSYQVIINNITHTLEVPSIGIDDLYNGSYPITIIINYTDGHEESLDYQLEINRPYQNPYNLRMEGSVLVFDSSVPTEYELYINDVRAVAFREPRIDITRYVELNTNSNIKISATYEGENYVSDVFVFNGLIPLDMDTEVDYILRSSDYIDVSLQELDEILYIKHNDEIIDESLYTYNRFTISFDKNIFFYPSYGINIYEVYTNHGYFTISINVIETENPHLYSPSSLDYIPLEDVQLEFNLLGGTFAQLSGYLLETSDYSFDDGILTIYASYIEGILAQEPDRENIVFSYQLQKDGNSYIGLIFIYL